MVLCSSYVCQGLFSFTHLNRVGRGNYDLNSGDYDLRLEKVKINLVVSGNCCIFVLRKENNMKKTDNLYIIFDGNTLSIMSSSDKPIQKEMDKYTLKHLKKTVMECIHNFPMVDDKTEIIKLLKETMNDDQFGGRITNTRMYNALVRSFQRLGIQYVYQVKEHHICEFMQEHDFGHRAMYCLRYFLDKYNLVTKQ